VWLRVVRPTWNQLWLRAVSAVLRRFAARWHLTAKRSGSNTNPGGIRSQLDALGTSHIGYGSMSLAALRLSIVGARPFSKVPALSICIF
jgi:hypothetical protein